jgi:hypothetical protein
MRKPKAQRKSRHKMWAELKQYVKAVILYEEKGILTRPAEDGTPWVHSVDREKYIHSFSPSQKLPNKEEGTYRSKYYWEILWRMVDIDASYRALREGFRAEMNPHEDEDDDDE